MGVALRGVGIALLVIGLSTTATATPLGLQPGDEVQSIEWDASQSIPGDGATFDPAVGPNGQIHADGRITAVTIQGPTTNPVVDTDLRFDMGFISDQVFPGSGPNEIGFLAFFGSAVNVTSDVAITDNSGVILTGDFAGTVTIGGVVNKLAGTINAPTLAVVGNINITGGNPNLVAALGGISAMAELQLSGDLSDFMPGLNVTVADNTAFNDFFTFTADGIIRPLDPSPFVPEPSTALLFGFGMLGMLAVSRRRR